jgi:hypothetical protein
MKNLPHKKGGQPAENSQEVPWIKAKLFQQKKASQIKAIQFHGPRHRG